MIATASAWRSRRLIWLCVAAGLLLIAAANAHLVYVAVSSQPDCVSHVQGGSSQGGTFSAAQSACTPDTVSAESE